MSISVLVLTKNEEQDLPGCLQSLAWSDDVHVLDSISTDNTAEIAVWSGANVISRAFDNWSSHQNWALRNIDFKYEWVYYSDADERVTPGLVVAMREAVGNPGGNVAFRIQRRDYLLGRWLKHVPPSAFNIRLFRPECVEYERVINPVTKVNGPVGDISAHFDHYPFSKGLAHWLERHNRYSTMEAEQIVGGGPSDLQFKPLQAIVARDKNQRRFHQKELFYRLPFRPSLMFLLLYVGRLGFLDGRAGLVYARLRSIYEYMIVLKAREMREGSRNP
jgi:glycosyltransferase involved in cell wall biosynthesis